MLDRTSIPAVGVSDLIGDIGSKASHWNLLSLRRIYLVLRACPRPGIHRWEMLWLFNHRATWQLQGGDPTNFLWRFYEEADFFGFGNFVLNMRSPFEFKVQKYAQILDSVRVLDGDVINSEGWEICILCGREQQLFWRGKSVKNCNSEKLNELKEISEELPNIKN